MIYISLCDDSNMDYEMVSSLVENYRIIKEIDISLRWFSSGEAFLESDDETDIVLMDVEMLGLDGIQTAKFLEKKGGDYVLTILSKKSPASKTVG